MADWGAFVGREGDLSRLQSALAGRVRLVLVIGDAGIGKSRFVAEGLSRASADGMLTVGGGCLPLTGKLPLLPVADVLSELSRLDGGGPFEAALAAAPDYVRPELARLLPRLAAGELAAAEPAEGWRHERLFTAIAELLYGVARRSPVALLVEDVHWADSASLDFLTYVVRAVRDSAMSVVATCRSDEAPLDPAVADWLTHLRQDARVEEIRIGPLSESDVAVQIAALMDSAPPGELVAEVYARTEGHPFFTEQLVAAAVTDSGGVAQPVRLPARLAELLVARTARCASAGQAVLAALAVAGRPLSEIPLGEVTGLDEDAVRAAVHELTEARLLAAPADGGHGPRQALLAEAVTAELLPSERITLHERMARALETMGGETLAAEAAGHWAAAGRTGEELHARLAAARVAEQLFAYADAATHWRRTIELCETEPNADLGNGIDLAHVHIRAVDALELSGDGVQAGVVAEEAYRRFADHPDPATAAAIHLRAGYLRAFDSPTAGRPLMNEALRLFEGTPPSAEHAKAWYLYAAFFLTHYEAPSPEKIVAALNRALEIADAAGAETLKPQILCQLAARSLVRGDVEGGFRLYAQAHNMLETSRDPWAALVLAAMETASLISVGKLEEATRVGLRGAEAARHGGVGSGLYATVLLGNTVEALLARGRIAEAAALVNPHTAGPVDRDNVLLHEYRAEIDLLRGALDAAAERLRRTNFEISPDFARDAAQRFAEVLLWAGRPIEAIEKVQRALEGAEGTEWVSTYAWVLAMG